MVNYQNGKIYKIVSEHTEKIYVGSTCEHYLSNRLSGHSRCFRHYKKHTNNEKYCTSFELFELGEVDIVLLENYPCIDKNELHARERYYIEQNKLNVCNKAIPTRTQKEYYEEKKDDLSKKMKIYREGHKDQIVKIQMEYYQENKVELKENAKQYREKHKEEIQEKKKKYYNANKPEILEHKRIYSQEHKDKIKLAGKKYREANQEKISLFKNEVIQCECGKTYSRHHKTRHQQTKYHLDHTND